MVSVLTALVSFYNCRLAVIYVAYDTAYLDVIRGYRVIVFCSRPNYQNNASVFFHVTLPGGAEIMIT